MTKTSLVTQAGFQRPQRAEQKAFTTTFESHIRLPTTCWPVAYQQFLLYTISGVAINMLVSVSFSVMLIVRHLQPPCMRSWSGFLSSRWCTGCWYGCQREYTAPWLELNSALHFQLAGEHDHGDRSDRSSAMLASLWPTMLQNPDGSLRNSAKRRPP